MYRSYAKKIVCHNGQCKEVESIQHTTPYGKVMTRSNQREFTLPFVNTPSISSFLLQTPTVFQNNRNQVKL